MCIYTMEFYSAIRKNEIILFAIKWIITGDYPIKQNKPDAEKQIICSLLFVGPRIFHRCTKPHTDRKTEGRGGSGRPLEEINEGN